MPLYEVAVIETPTKDEADRGEKEKLVFGPKPVIARDPQSAAIAATMGGKIESDPSRWEVLVRPFC